MGHEGIVSPGPADVCGIGLLGLWDIDLDSHSSFFEPSTPSHGFVACRTFEGGGQLILGDEVVDVPPASLTIVQKALITRARPKNGHWRLWWLEFECQGVLDAPKQRPLQIEADPRDPADFEEAKLRLKSKEPVNRQIASSLVGLMLRRWLATWSGRWSNSTKQKTICDIIDKVYADVGARWTVGRLASEFGMTERHLNQLFHQMVGESPKRFLNRIRLLTAEQMLKFGRMSVKEVAAELGFSSPSHFANAFSAFFGVSPSQCHDSLNSKNGKDRAERVDSGL